MITVSDKDIGRMVIYRRNGTEEIGTITSVNPLFAFVRYGADLHSKGTLPADLDWYSEAPREASR